MNKEDIVKNIKETVLEQFLYGELTNLQEESSDELINEILNKKNILINSKVPIKRIPLNNITDSEKYHVIPKNWKWVRIEDIFIVSGGKRLPKGYKGTEEKTDNIYIRVKNMKNDTIIDNGLLYISDEIKEKITKYYITKDDLYITVAGTIGKVGNVPEEYDMANLTENANRLQPLLVNIDYYKYLLNSYSIQNEISELTTKAAQPKLAIKRINNLVVPLPPIDEQTRIVSRIEELLTIINSIDTAKFDLKKRIELVKKNVVIKGISGRLSKKNIEYKNIEKEPFPIPKNWEWKKLSEIVKIKLGKTPSTKDLGNWEGEIPWFSVGDLNHREVVFDTKRKITESSFEKDFKNVIVKKGTLVMSFKLTIGKLSILGKDALHNEAICNLVPINSDDLNIKYLMNALDGLDLTKDKKDAIKGSTLNKSSLANIMVPIPPMDEQEEIVTRIDEIFEKLNDIEKQIN